MSNFIDEAWRYASGQAEAEMNAKIDARQEGRVRYALIITTVNDSTGVEERVIVRDDTFNESIEAALLVFPDARFQAFTDGEVEVRVDGKTVAKIIEVSL